MSDREPDGENTVCERCGMILPKKECAHIHDPISRQWYFICPTCNELE